MKIRKIFARILVVLLALVTAVLVLRAILNFTEGKLLVRKLIELKDKGVPLSAKDLAPPCPDGDNGALLWKAAEDLFIFDKKDNALLSEVHRNFVLGKPFDVEKREPLSRLIEKNRKALDLILEASGKTCFQYGDPSGKLWEKKIPRYVTLYAAMRLLGLEAFLSAEKGDMTTSLDQLRKGLRFSPKIAEDGTLMTYLVGLAQTRICLLFLDNAVRGREVSEELLFPLLDDLGDDRIGLWKTLLKGSLSGEKVLFLEVIDKKPAEFLKDMDADGWANRLLFWLIRPLIKRDIRLNIPMYLEIEAQAELTYYRTKSFWKSHQERLDRLPWYAVVSKAMIPNIESACLKVATIEAIMLTARTGLACRVFKSRTGEYPDRLEALVPGLLSRVPIDPFTGEPLVYRREGKGFIVYSLGSNLKDDGGRSTWQITQMVAEKDDDWTWKENR